MKFTEWVVVILVMAMFLSLVGIPTGMTSTLQYMGVNITTAEVQNADIGNSGFWNYLFGSTTGTLIVLLGGVGLAVIGFFAKGYDVSLVILTPVVFITGLFIGLFWSTIKYIMEVPGVQSWMVAIVTIIFVGIGTAFILSALDYFAGR